VEKLDDTRFVSRLDLSNMLRLISELPDQCKKAYEIGNNIDSSKSDSKIGNIVFAGLGGSAIGADIVRIYLQNESKVPIVVCRNYTLPDFVDKNTLLFCSSYSGNTEETLSSFEDGLERGADIITMGSGGRLKDLSIKNGFKHIEIPSGYPPRTGVAYMSITVIAILAKLGFIEDKEKDIRELYLILSDLRDKEISMDVTFRKNIAKKIAKKLYGRYCVVYGTSDTTEAVTIRWRGQLAENSKSLSSSHVLPEMNHNEIVGWEFPKKLLKGFKVVILRDENDHPRTKNRIEISKKIIKKSGAEIIELKGKKGSLISRLFSLIYIGDFVSFYLAILNGIDPTPVKRVDYLKAQLAKI
jgi:glucose/mannose-6-phosphate isomerase